MLKSQTQPSTTAGHTDETRGSGKKYRPLRRWALENGKLVPLRRKRKWLRGQRQQYEQQSGGWASPPNAPACRRTAAAARRATSGNDLSKAPPEIDASNAAGTLRGNVPAFRPAASMEEKEGLAKGLVGAPRGAKTEGRGCLVGAPRGVKTTGNVNNAAGALRGDAPVFHPQASTGEMDTLPSGLVGAPMGAKMEGRGCPVGAPKGVKTEGTPSNAAGALRGDAPVFHPGAGRREIKNLPHGLVRTPGGVKTEGRGARTETLEPVATRDGEEEEATNRVRPAAS